MLSIDILAKLNGERVLTDPTGVVGAQRTGQVHKGGNNKSYAYYDCVGYPTFFVTEDTRNGPLVRFFPDDRPCSVIVRLLALIDCAPCTVERILFYN
eukprot:scaffold1168_cov167-Amphora_coffeaeformis.AAC.41